MHKYFSFYFTTKKYIKDFLVRVFMIFGEGETPTEQALQPILVGREPKGNTEPFCRWFKFLTLGLGTTSGRS